jgi:hypothetical protein
MIQTIIKVHDESITKNQRTRPQPKLKNTVKKGSKASDMIQTIIS